MNRKIVRKINKIKEKTKSFTGIIGIVVVGLIILVGATILIINSILKSNEYKKLVKKVEEQAIKYVNMNYPSLDNSSSVIFTLNDLIGEKLIANLKSPYSEGYCNTNSAIEVNFENNNKKVQVDLICGSKNPNKISNPIELVKEEQFNEFVWSNKDIRLKINSGTKNIYTIINNSQVVAGSVEALNNEIIIGTEGTNYVKIDSYENDSLIKSFYTPIYRIDKQKPVIDLKEATVLVKQGQIYEMPKCIASDNLTPVESMSCNIMGFVNTEIVDSYPLEYIAKDLAGNISSKKITVVIESPLLKDILKETKFSGNPTNNYLGFDGDIWRIMGHNGTNVQLVGPKISARAFDSKPYNGLAYNTWLEDSRRYKGRASSLYEYLNNSYYGSMTTKSKDMIADNIFEEGKISTTTLSDWEICAGLNVTESSWDASYTIGTFTSANCYLKGEEDKYSFWTKTPFPGTNDRVWKIGLNGSASNNNVSIYSYVLPTLFLKADVIVLGGTGTEKDPYIIGQ